VSDLDVAEALGEIESALAGPEIPTPEALAQWRARFDAAVATAERGPGWEGLVKRAHHLAAQVGQLGATLAERRDDVRRELEHQAAGNRALKSYGATTQP
jgi:flagellar hook-associated protein FlgK